MISLFNINNHCVDTSNFSNLLHDQNVTDLENTLKKYVGAKYACSISSATNAIFLSLLEKRTTINIPSIIPPVVLNATLAGTRLILSTMLIGLGIHMFCMILGIIR